MSKLTRDQILSIRGMKDKDMTNAEIADELKVSIRVVARWIKRLRSAGYDVKKTKSPGRPAIQL